MSHYKSHQPSIYLIMAGILSLGYEKFDKKKKQTEAGSAQPEPDVRLARLGESFTLDGVSWQSNDESKSYRQMRNGTAAFFHFGTGTTSVRRGSYTVGFVWCMLFVVASR
jgi:hypothetical protein